MQVGKLVTLDGSRSIDPNADRLTYYWEQVFGSEHAAISEKGITLSDNTAEMPQFMAPTEPRLLKFKLTVTDPYGETDSDTVVIDVHRPPVANAGPDQTVLPGTKVELDGSASHDPDGSALSYRWKRTFGPEVELSNDRAVKPTFTAPNTETLFQFRLIVADKYGSYDIDHVVIKVRNQTETWGEWTATGNERTDPDDSLKIQREEQRTSNLGNTETRWVFDRNVPETWGPWTPTGNHQGCGPDRQAEQSPDLQLSEHRDAVRGRPRAEDLERVDGHRRGSWLRFGPRGRAVPHLALWGYGDSMGVRSRVAYMVELEQHRR